MLLRVHPKTPQRRYLDEAVEAMRGGAVIIYPTDTVYGIGCSIFNSKAIERVYRVKKQNRAKPFSFMCSDLSHISDYAKVSNMSFRLMKQLIPGPYTFILPASRLKQLPRSMISKRKEVGIRVPDNRICLELIALLGHPVLNASIQNVEGEIVNDPDIIYKRYGHLVDLMLDGGPGTLELSTILDLTGETPLLVREGAGDVRMIQSFN
jgi:tRNA threonylcarbamoyl adenosine modification protein (Sua5/YciO/YrdC/YwlC family)